MKNYREVYDKRQVCFEMDSCDLFWLSWLPKPKFGTVDGHMGVCAFGRDSLLNASHIAEDRGFNVIHGIVDSLWLKKDGASSEDYVRLSEEIAKEVDLPLDFSGSLQVDSFSSLKDSSECSSFESLLWG